MSQNKSRKKDGHQKQSSKSESTEIIVPQLTLAPNSNFHKWEKQILKQIKKDYGTIHDSVVSGKYPNFLEESMRLILTPPEEIFREMTKGAKAGKLFGKSISSPGRLSFLIGSQDAESSSDGEEEKDEEDKAAEYEKDDLESMSPPLESLLKMSFERTSAERRERRQGSTVNLTEQQRTLINNYINGKQKLINDLEFYFTKNLPCVCAYIISTFSPQTETRVRQHRKFETVYSSDDVVGLMKIIRECAVLTPLDKPNLANRIRKKRDGLYQGNKSLDFFCELFNQFEKDLIELDRPTLEEDLIVEFLNHLHPSYCSIITQWKMAGIMPQTIDSVQAKLREYESLALAQSSVMKNPIKQSDSGSQDVAMTMHSKPSGKKVQSTAQQAQQAQSSSKPHRKPLTEEQAKTLGLKKLPCCGKYGSHKPQDCRHPTKSEPTNSSKPNPSISPSSVHAAAAAHSSKSKKAETSDIATAAVKGPSFYEDEEFGLVIMEPVSPTVDSVVLPAMTQQTPIVLYLDTGASSNAVPVNSPIVYNVHDIPTRDIVGIGQQSCTKAGFIAHFGPALLIPGLSVHLISLSVQRSRGMHIHYIQDMDLFELNHGDNVFVFTRRDNHLYGFDYLPPLSTVHLKLDKLINGRYYTEEQVQRASAGRALHYRCGHLSSDGLRFAINNGTFLNCPVTAQDITLADEIFGPCTGCTQGKLTHALHPRSTVARWRTCLL